MTSTLSADPHFDTIVNDLHLKGRVDEAREAYTRLLEQTPDHAGALANLGQILRSKGEKEQALALYRRASTLPDATAELLFNLANAEDDAGNTDVSLEWLDRALAQKPEMIQALHKQGLIYSRLSRWDDAALSLRNAARLAPTHWVIRCDLAVAMNHSGAPELAEPLLRWAIMEKPEAVRPRRLLADLLSRTKRLDEAEGMYRELVKDDGPEQERATLSLADQLLRQNKMDDAIGMLRSYHNAAPDSSNVALALAGSLLRVHMVIEAAAICRQVLEKEPDSGDAHYTLASALTLLHQNDEAQHHGMRAIELAEDAPAAISNHLFSSLNSTDLTAEQLAEKHRVMAARLPTPTKPLPKRGKRGPKAPLRLGFYTPDLFGRHPVPQFFERVLANLDRSRFHPVIYSSNPQSDETTKRFQEMVPTWHDVSQRTDALIYELIRTDGPDILFDLAGHTAGNGLRIFSKRLAPVQISYIGYPHSTGLTEMDWIISDNVVTPPELEHLYTEKILRPNPCLWLFNPPPPGTVIPRTRPPAKPGAITFGSLNTTSKLSDRCLSLWSQILARCPQATLLLKAGSFAEKATIDSFKTRLEGFGAPLSQVTIEPPEPFETALGTYDLIDIMLDAIPFNGGTTTCQALWMGVPVLTRQGQAMCQRLSSSFLTAVGLEEMITTSDDDYVDLACALANNPKRVARLRKGLREKVLASPICNERDYVANLQTALLSLV